MPKNIDDYIHRIGRTGRIGQVGRAVSFLNYQCKMIYGKLYKLLKSQRQVIPDWFEKECQEIMEVGHGIIITTAIIGLQEEMILGIIIILNGAATPILEVIIILLVGLLKTKVIMEDGIILLVGIVMKSKISITSREIEAEVGVIVVIERQSQIQTGIRKRMLIGMDSQAMSLKAHGN